MTVSSSTTASSVAAAAAAKGPTLPAGWKEVKHAATGQVGRGGWGVDLLCALGRCGQRLLMRSGAGWCWVGRRACLQVYYYHEESKTKRWTPPTSETEVASDIVQRQKEHVARWVVRSASIGVWPAQAQH